MSCRRAEQSSDEREPISLNDDEAGGPSKPVSIVPSKPSSVVRDGAAPCMALTALLLAVAVVGSVAVGVAIAAFDPAQRANVTAKAAATDSGMPPQLAEAAAATVAGAGQAVGSSKRKLIGGSGWGFREEEVSTAVWRVTSGVMWADAIAGLANG
eukprot:6889617-Prymnesium_polylepis.1